MRTLLVYLITQVFFLKSAFLVAGTPSLSDVIASVQKDGSVVDVVKSDVGREFVCTKSFKSNLRNGPGLNFPVAFEILMKDYPLLIIKKIDTWYAVEDFQGSVAWVSRVNVKERCGAVVKSNGLSFVRFLPSEKSKVILSLEKGFVVRELECLTKDWCEVKIYNKKGWMRRKDLWGRL